MSWRKWRYCDFHKVSAWFVRAEMNSPKLIFVSSETLSTYHKLNLNQFWVIPHRENVNWKVAAKCDISILKCWFSKAFRELQFTWNGPVVDLNHPSILPIQIYQIWFDLAFFYTFHVQSLFAPTQGTDFRHFTATDARFSFSEFSKIKKQVWGRKKKKENRGAQFLDKVLLPALGIHRITINHTHWKCLTSIFLYNRTLTVAMKSSKSGAQPIISLISYCSWNLQGRIKSYFLLHERHKNQQFQISVHIGFCTVHQSCLEIDIWHMLWQYLHDLSTKYKQNSPYFDKYFHFVWIKLYWIFLIIVNWIKTYWHGILNDTHVYC